MLNGRQILENIRRALQIRKIKEEEIYKIIPRPTLLGLNRRNDMRLSTIFSLSKLLGVRIDQLTGELPLNLDLHYVPLRSWGNLDSKEVNLLQQGFITTLCTAENAFALRVEEDINEKYSYNTVIIVEPTTKFNHSDEIVVSISGTKPVIRKVYPDGTDIYLEIPSSNLPKKLHNTETIKIYGVIRESRIYKR